MICQYVCLMEKESFAFWNFSAGHGVMPANASPF